jgi:hypothetical protein
MVEVIIPKTLKAYKEYNCYTSSNDSNGFEDWIEKTCKKCGCMKMHHNDKIQAKLNLGKKSMRFSV